MDYRVIEDTSESDLSVRIKNLTKLGWIPQGGVSVVQLGGLSMSTWYYQAMIKPETNTNKEIT